MDFLIAAAFGAGVAGFAYTKLGRRVGYGDKNSVWTITGVVFVVFTLIFFSILHFFVPHN